MNRVLLAAAVLTVAASGIARAETIGDVDTAFKLIGPDHKIVVDAYDDPKVAAGQESLIAAAKQAINVQYPRPQLADYQHLSAILQKDIQDALIGTITPEAALQDAASKAQKLH